jgi:UDP-glucose 4-epimerase
MKVLVTGGAGFIGSWVVEQYVRKGHQVTVFDNFSTGLRENLKGAGEAATVVEGDICDYDRLRFAMKGQECVNHHAAQLEITTAIEHPARDAEVNIIGSLNVLRAMKEEGIKQAVFASSACVYGNLDQYLVKEDAALMPNWEYGVSKLAVERYCDIVCAYEGFDIVSLRYGIVYGEREWYGRALTAFVKRAFEGGELVVFGEGRVVRDFIHAEDVARLNVIATERRARGHVILNAGTGLPTTIKRMAETIVEIVRSEEGRNISITHEMLNEGEISTKLAGRVRLPRELRIMSLDCGKALGMYGWKPEVSLELGLKREYAWVKENSRRWTKMSC